MSPAMRNGRCRMHGGPSTGCRTPEGLQRMKQSKIRTGRYTREAISERRQVTALLRRASAFVRKGIDPEAAYEWLKENAGLAPEAN